MADKYKFSKGHSDPDIQQIQREIQDNLVSFDKDGNIVLDADLYCRDLITSGDSIYIGSKKKKNKLNVKADELYYNEIKITQSDQDRLYDPTGVGIAPHASIHESGGYDEINHYDLVEGLGYGAMYTNADIAVALTNQNEWYEIDAVQAWTTGKLNGCTFTDPKITVTNAGVYLIQYSTGASMDANTQEIEFGIMIDSTKTDSVAHGTAGIQAEGRNHRKFSNVNDVGAMSGTGIVQLAAGKTISLAARNVTSASDTITVAHSNLTIVRLV